MVATNDYGLIIVRHTNLTRAHGKGIHPYNMLTRKDANMEHKHQGPNTKTDTDLAEVSAHAPDKKIKNKKLGEHTATQTPGQNT